MLLELHADLDIPGETGRQARVFFIWVACLALAIGVASCRTAAVTKKTRETNTPTAALEAGRRVRAAWGIFFGLALPAVLTVGLNHRRKRGGSHARGIVVDVTADGELRLWGRGYGSRLDLDGARVQERLVDTYCGRLGAWRQRRLRVSGRHGKRRVEIELATQAIDADEQGELAVTAGEGDCVELDRASFNELRNVVLRHAERAAEREPVRKRGPEKGEA